MVTIAIYFETPGKLDYPLDHKIYYESYGDFCRYALTKGIKVCIVRGKQTYLGEMQFSHGWTFTQEGMVDISEPIKADIIYMKGTDFGPKTDSNEIIVNDYNFEKLIENKMVTYGMFSQYMANSYYITKDNWQEVIDNIKTSRLVLKPLDACGGKGIIICNKNEFKIQDLPDNEPYLAQDFVDTSKGIPGLTDGMHDLRLLLFNGEVKLAYMRIPKEGSFLANISQGASAQAVPSEKIPQSAIAIAKDVDSRFRKYYPLVYTVDFMFEGERPYVVELNSQPGFPNAINEGPEYTAYFYQYMLDLLLSAVPQA